MTTKILDMNEMLKLLGEHDVFAGLSTKELQALAPIIERNTYTEGELVYDTSQVPNFLFLIESGSFVLQHANLSGKHKLYQRGQLIGEVGVINGDFRSGVMRANEQSSVISICGTRLFRERFVPPKIALKIVRALSKRITNYLRTKEQISTKEIIKQGENDYVEFKSTLRWNLFTEQKDKAITLASLKTLAAFLNTNGGLLLIGVADDGKILGLAKDQFSNTDKLLLHLTNTIKEHIGAVFLKFLNFSIEKIEEKQILRIDCKPANLPAYLSRAKFDHFYIRTGPATTDLRLSQVYQYINNRFEQARKDVFKA